MLAWRRCFPRRLAVLPPACLQGIAASDGAGGAGSELEVALQWLNVLYARECQPGIQHGDEEAGAPGGQAGSVAVAAATAEQQAQRQGSRAAATAGSRRSPPAGPAVPRYESVLLQLLAGLREASLPSSRLIVRCGGRPVGLGMLQTRGVATLHLRTPPARPPLLSQHCPPPPPRCCSVLLEAPALPQPAVRAFLAGLIEGGPDWCTLSLLAARDCLLQRPPSRPALLELVLEACTSPTADTRSKAVRLAANRLFPDPSMAPAIEQAARRRLDAMVPPPAPVAAAVPAQLAAGSQPVSPAASPEQPPPGSQPGSPAAPLEAAAGEPAVAMKAEPTAAAGGAAPAAGEAAAAVKHDAGAEAAGEHAGGQPAAEAVAMMAEAPPPGPTDAEAAQLCALYCALCTKKHSLLRHLFEVYGQTSGKLQSLYCSFKHARRCSRGLLHLPSRAVSPALLWPPSADGGRAAIKRNAGGLAKTLGAAAPALLAVVQDPPAGSVPLVLQMLHVLTEAAVPPQPMVAACLQLHGRCKDARVLVPALRGLDRSAALRQLPALLELEPEQLRPALARLVAPLPPPAEQAVGAAAAQQRVVVSPEELLSALHTLDHSRDPGLLQRMMQGVTVCITSPQLFPPEALAACINKLLTRVPLPQLFMRTVIQTVAAAPRLRPFVVGILRQVGGLPVTCGACGAAWQPSQAVKGGALHVRVLIVPIPPPLPPSLLARWPCRPQLAAKQVWKDGTQWKGWLMCAQQMVPDSLPVLLSLPAEVLGAAAKAMPEGTKQQLLEYARQGANGVPATTLAALEQLAAAQPAAAQPAAASEGNG